MTTKPERVPLILASASPRRRALLSALGLAFEVFSADVDETPRPGEGPLDLACRLSREKAAVVAARFARGIVLASDTVVALDDDLLGKPATSVEALTMLRRLRGREHQVLTAVTALEIAAGRELTTCSLTRVWMRAYSDAEIQAYIAGGDPFDKAGGYAIQHPTFDPVARIDGCYSGVMGFPLGHVTDGLAALGLRAPRPPEVACERWRGWCCRSHV